MKEQKLTWNDVERGYGPEIAKKYKWDARKTEQEVRRHLDGASHKEIKNISAKFYDQGRR